MFRNKSEKLLLVTTRYPEINSVFDQNYERWKDLPLISANGSLSYQFTLINHRTEPVMEAKYIETTTNNIIKTAIIYRKNVYTWPDQAKVLF